MSAETSVPVERSALNSSCQHRPVGVKHAMRMAVARVIARGAVRSGALWGLLFGVAIASSELSYVKIYPTADARRALAAAYGSNKAMSALFGPASKLETVGGFTAFKVAMTLMILGAVWGLLLSTGLTRGEEDAGRWDLLLAGPTTSRRASVQAVFSLGLGCLALWLVSSFLAGLSGRDATVQIGPGASTFFTLAMATTALMFLAIGAVAAQLSATRRQAASLGLVVLGLSYAVRLLADAGIGLHGLIWASPLGWVEELGAMTNPQPLVLLPIVGLTAVLASIAIFLSGRRDVGSGLLPEHAHASARVRLLSGPTGLAVRLLLGRIVGWLAAISLVALLYGLIAKSAGTTLSGSAEEVFARLGAPAKGAQAVLGACFLVLALLLSCVAAGQVTAIRTEESDGHLDLLLAAPVPRWRWLGGRTAVALTVLVASGLLAGVIAWLGGALQHAGVSLGTLLDAGVNLVPPAVAVVGFGILVFGLRPRLTSIAVYGLIGWSLLVIIVGGIGAVDHWVLDTSVFHHMASAPAVPPDWGTNAVLTGIGVACALVGGIAFSRRDIQGV